eukprot:CAMPEP_0179410512 /NCGR_PEP_ID=MMETSP0799-20121207/3333_1 /TAXON_ID=46947 /ORGANISM="Geminigera cryophila, Strain CCMP2564" /LENGTH=138 /DNA_ID=CAMNT_0021182379 /DNA_START=78 /DNA_END=495 /DNA_ORIENTATION=+
MDAFDFAATCTHTGRSKDVAGDGSAARGGDGAWEQLRDLYEVRVMVLTRAWQVERAALQRQVLILRTALQSEACEQNSTMQALMHDSSTIEGLDDSNGDVSAVRQASQDSTTLLCVSASSSESGTMSGQAPQAAGGMW